MTRSLLRSTPPTPRVTVAILLWMTASVAATGSDADVKFHEEVVPILRASCVTCHRPDKQEGGLDLSTHATILAGGRSGQVVVPEDADDSLLIDLVRALGEGRAPEMPQDGEPLADAEVDVLRRWIDQGALENDRPEERAEDLVYRRAPVITTLAFSPDRSTVAVGGGREVVLLDAATLDVRTRLLDVFDRIEAVAYSADGALLAATGGTPGLNGKLAIWRASDHALLLEKTLTADVLRGVSWSPDGSLIAVGGADNVVRAIDTQSGEEVLYQGAHEDWVLDTVFSTDGSHLVSVGRDRSMKLIKVATQQFIDNITSITPGAVKGGLMAIDRLPAEDTLLTGGEDGVPRIYKMFREKKRVIGDDYNLIRALDPMPGRVTAVAFSQDGRLAAAVSSDGARGALSVHTVEDGAKVFEHTDHRPLYAVAFGADGGTVAVGGVDGSLDLYRTSDGAPVRKTTPFPVARDDVDGVTEAGSTEASAEVAGTTEAGTTTAASIHVPSLQVGDEFTIWPGAITLENPFQYAQLLVACRTADGSMVDVTGDVLALENDLVTVDEDRLVRPKKDGAGELVLILGSTRASLPITVRGQRAAFTPDFGRDAAPIVSRLGCNAGTCHGSEGGKNGFKLSLRGYDPVFDHDVLTDDLGSRRVNRADSARSLFLRKPTGAVPHGGGRILTEDSYAYRMLRAWVDQGAAPPADVARVARIEILPENPVLGRASDTLRMIVLAHFPDGRVQDVSREAFVEGNNLEVLNVTTDGIVTALRRGEGAVLARYEGQYAATRVTVMGDRAGFEWSDPPTRNEIDVLVHEKLKRVKTLPADLCTDVEFLRRVHLDLTGLAPTARDIKTFEMDRRPTTEKRDAVIDRLIGSPAFIEHWSRRWADLLQVNTKFMGQRGASALRDWIRGEVASNTPYDQFVRSILTASGSTLLNPPAAYFQVLREPDLVMENTTQLFLGVRFNCNKCHDHPFERWTQNDHWSMAAFFGQVERRNAEGSPMIGDPSHAEEEIIADVAVGEVKHPKSGAVLSPRFPYTHEAMHNVDGPRRAALAEWLVAPENPYFARSYVNRVWSYLLGVGLIDPVDDIRASNPPSNPPLLDWLERGFLANDFDVRWLLRVICQSRTYQHALATNRFNADDEINFSHAYARRLPAEVLYDAIHQATGSKGALPGVVKGTLATELLDANTKASDGFLDLFGRPRRESACECERASGLSLGQALNLVNGETFAAAIADPSNAITDLLAVERAPAKIVDGLFTSFLCRSPTDEEIAAFAKTFDPNDPRNLDALDPDSAAELDRRVAAWEAGLSTAAWRPLSFLAGRASSGASLMAHDDGSVLVTGPLADKDTYTVTFGGAHANPTGLRIEALPDPSLGGHGPGRAENGNFVLTELIASIVPTGDEPKARPLTLFEATADYSQGGFPVAAAIDGNLDTVGWALSPRLGVVHTAVFEVSDDVGANPDEGGTLTLTLIQQYGGNHTLGRFRVSTTDSPRPIRYADLPDVVVEALKIPATTRDEAARGIIAAHVLSQDPEMADRLRLAAARDLAWALASSPGFLFNR